MIKNLPVLQSVSAFCHLPFTKLICNGEGYVSMCCYQVSQLGSIFDNELIDLWNSPKAQEIRSQTLQGELHGYCSSWNVCPYLVQDKIPYPFDTHKDFKFPTWIEINLPESHCNVGGENPTDENPACIMCIRNHRVLKLEDKTEFICSKVKPILPWLKSLCVLGIAEPFWKNKLFEVLKWLDFAPYKHKIRFFTHTNATLLTPRVLDQFFDAIRLSDLSFSIDAATAETFVKIRRLDAYDLVIKNIKNYMQHLSNNNIRHKHQTKIYNNINLLNVSEMEQMVQTAADLEVDQIWMLPTHNQIGLVTLDELTINKKNVHIFARNAEKAKIKAEQLGVTLYLVQSFDTPPPVLEDHVYNP